jgi:DNA-binding NarL/FixJ family response regulator
MRRIVIIEDEFYAAQHLSKLITNLEYEVKGIYHSGEEFLDETDWEFDAAIVDVFLADEMTGFDVAKHMNQNAKPFIFLTANQDEATVKKATELLPSAYLSKPFKANDVSAALNILWMRMQVKKESSFNIFLRKNSMANDIFTSREVDILMYIMEGLTNSEICDKLFISNNTVKYHVKNVFLKLNSNSRTEIQEKVNSFLNLK